MAVIFELKVLTQCQVCLNPCFNGEWGLLIKWRPAFRVEFLRLNPCYIGRGTYSKLILAERDKSECGHFDSVCLGDDALGCRRHAPHTARL